MYSRILLPHMKCDVERSKSSNALPHEETTLSREEDDDATMFHLFMQIRHSVRCLTPLRQPFCDFRYSCHLEHISPSFLC